MSMTEDSSSTCMSVESSSASMSVESSSAPKSAEQNKSGSIKQYTWARNFVCTWKDQFTWVECVDKKMFCRVCRKYLDIADQISSIFKGISRHKHIETLKAHHNSNPHKWCVVRDKLVSKQSKGPLDKIVTKMNVKMDEKTKTSMKALLILHFM